MISSLHTLLPTATITRQAGADRYATSRLVTSGAFTSTSKAFIATGTNFPDALAAAATAGKLGAPVILVNGTASALDSATLALLTSLGITDLYLAGGTGVISPGIETSLKTRYGATHVTRLSGADRYATSVAINKFGFGTTGTPTVFLATGTGYADALAGAALAGKTGTALFVTPGTCVPTDTLTTIRDLGATTIRLLGGTNALTTHITTLSPC